MSETSKHTPGPWVLMPEFHGDHGQYYITDEADGSEIASVTAWIGEHRAEAEANARLIAAAPDLLSALVMLRDADDIGVREGYSGGMGPEQRFHVDAAIAKAEGATP